MPATETTDEPLVEKRLRFPASVTDLVRRTARANRLSESDVFRALVKQGIEASRKDWEGRA